VKGSVPRVAVAALILALASAGIVVGVRGSSSRAGASTASPSASPAIVQIHSLHGASLVPALSGLRPLFILALGSDARPGEAVQSQRSDSIHLIGIDPAHDRATILGFPRDSMVSIPGHGTGKINTALFFGGPALLAQTVENLTGIRIDFWMLTSFPGLVNMVNGIGGLRVYVPIPLHDSFSGAFFSRGYHQMNGGQALAFARDRHDFPTGDLARSANQGAIMKTALGKLHTVFEQDPSVLLKWIAVGWRNIVTDLSVETMVSLAFAATQVPARNVNNLIVPTHGGSVGGASVEFIDASAQSIFADMRDNGIVGS